MLTFDPSFFIGVFPRLISALPFTVEVIIASILLCLFFGTIIAVIRIAPVPVLAPFCDIWLSYNRSMPFILDLYLVYFCLPAIIRGLGINPDGWPLTVYVLVSLTFHYAPVISEILRPLQSAHGTVHRGRHRLLGTGHTPHLPLRPVGKETSRQRLQQICLTKRTEPFPGGSFLFFLLSNLKPAAANTLIFSSE